MLLKYTDRHVLAVELETMPRIFFKFKFIINILMYEIDRNIEFCLCC